MSYILYINGNPIELSEASPIAQTKQVNDIASLENRQTNFTNKFTVPPTPSNVRAMDKLYITGNTSNIPYQKNTCDLFDAVTGLCMIYKGWANITGSSDKGYEIYVYDGNLEIYKAVENKTLGDLDLTELTHIRTLEEVISTFDDSKPYKYILADFNGKAVYDTNKVNIDYLVPSIRASWFLSKIEAFTGFELNGSFKTNPDFINLFMTYPKGLDSTDTTNLLVSDDLSVGVGVGIYNLNIGSTSTLDPSVSIDGTGAIVFSELVTIEIEIKSNFKIKGISKFKINGFVGFMTVHDIPVRLYENINGVERILKTFNADGSEVNYSYKTIANAGDRVKFYLKVVPHPVYTYTSIVIESGGFMDIETKKDNTETIDFLDELKGMSMRDFLNEIVWGFGLTLFKEKYTNVYNLKGIPEITNRANTIDWTKKFVSKKGEKYIIGNYAQNSFIRYKYNDENSKHNDGFLVIENENLEDSKTIIQSKIYSPELSSSTNLGFVTKTFKLWEKEPKDDGTVTYKALANRFYFMRSIEKTFFTDITIGSESLATSTTISTGPVASFGGLKKSEIIMKYYPEIAKILSKSQILICEMWLKNKDVNDVDFSVPYYFEQLGGNFILNKINNFIPGKKTDVEIIRLNDVNQPIYVPIPDYSSADYTNDYYI